MVRNFLKTKIINLISEKGNLSIAEFMNLALLDKDFGYYQKNNPFGESGDFITAPEISQIFGEIIGCYAALKWIKLGKPKSFSLIEFGPGNASLLDDCLRATKKIAGFHSAIEIHLIEASERLALIQSERLKKYALPLIHHQDFFDLPEKPSFIIANEFFDALAITQYQFQNSLWHERKIGLDQKMDLVFCLETNDGLKNLELPFQLILGPNFPPKNGDIYEISFPTIKIMKQISEFCHKTNSAALIIDYGYFKKSYGDSLQGLRNHQYIDVFAEIGESDLTIHVDFSLLHHIAKEQNLEAILLSQREFLLTSGIAERRDVLVKNQKTLNQKNKLLESTNRLIAKDQMGELFKILYLP